MHERPDHPAERDEGERRVEAAIRPIAKRTHQLRAQWRAGGEVRDDECRRRCGEGRHGAAIIAGGAPRAVEGPGALVSASIRRRSYCKSMMKRRISSSTFCGE